MSVHFHKRRLIEDQDLFVREGDFVLYGQSYYEIVSTDEDGSQSLVNTNHTIYGDDYDEFYLKLFHLLLLTKMRQG